jgi:hypothetical protein
VHFHAIPHKVVEGLVAEGGGHPISLKTSQEIIQTEAKKSLTTYNPPEGF